MFKNSSGIEFLIKKSTIGYSGHKVMNEAHHDFWWML